MTDDLPKLKASLNKGKDEAICLPGYYRALGPLISTEQSATDFANDYVMVCNILREIATDFYITEIYYNQEISDKKLFIPFVRTILFGRPLIDPDLANQGIVERNKYKVPKRDYKPVWTISA